MDFTIYSIGDPAFLEQVLIAIAMIAEVDDFSAMVQVGMVVGVFITVASAIASGGRNIDFQHILLGYILWAVLFVPTATVTIEDSYTGDVRVVDNVPMGPAAAGGIISLIGYKLTLMFEVAYGPIIPRVTETEFAESLRLLNTIRNKATSSAIWRALDEAAGGGGVNLKRSWYNYIKDCTTAKIDLDVMSANELSTGPYLESLRFDANLFGTQIFVDPADRQGTEPTCAEAWNALIDKTDMVSDPAIEAFNAILGFDVSNLPAGESARTKTDTALAALIGSGIDAQTYMRIAILEPVMMEAIAGKYRQLHDYAAANMINQAIQQRNTSWAAEQTLFMSIVRPMISFFEAFVFAITPIMAFVIVLGSKGTQLAGKYLMLLIWIQLWMPLLSIINLYIYIAATRKMDSYSLMSTHNWDSFYALHSAADTMQTWVATGGLLAASTPAVALMLIYGSAVTATHLAGRLRSSDVIDEKYTTPDLSNNPPLVNRVPPLSYEPASGMKKAGATFGGLDFGNSFSRDASSSAEEAVQISNRLNDELSRGMTSSSSQSENQQRARDYQEALKASGGEAYKVVADTTTQFMNKAGIDQSHREAVEGVVGATLSGSIGASGQVSPSALYRQVSGKLEKMGINPGSGVGLSGNVRADAQTRDVSGDSIASSAGQALARSLTSMQGITNTADYATIVAKGFSENLTDSHQEKWEGTHALKLSQAYQSAALRSQTYAEMARKSEQFGVSGNIPLEKAAVDTIENGSSDQFLRDAARFKMIMGSDSAYTRQLLRAEQDFRRDGIAPMQAMVMAAYRTMTDPRAYEGNRIFEPDGMNIAFKAFMASQGRGPSDQTDVSAAVTNEGVGHTSLPLNDPGRKAIVPELTDSKRRLDQGPVSSGEVVPLDDSSRRLTRAKYEAFRTQATASGSSEESPFYQEGLKRAAAINAKVERGWGQDAPTATLASGALDAAKLNHGGFWRSQLEQGSGFVAGVSKSLPGLVEQVQSMSPEQARAYTSEYANRSAGFSAVFDSAKGAVASLAGGKPSDMSYGAYYDALSAAGAQAIAEGGAQADENVQRIVQAGYNARMEEAKSFGLSTQDGTTQLYAETFAAGLVQDFRRFGEVLGVDLQANYGTEGMTTAMDTLKRSLIPLTNENGYQVHASGPEAGQLVRDSDGSAVRLWHWSSSPEGERRVVLEDETLDRLAENTSNAIYKASWTGQWAGGYLAETNMVLDLLNSQR